MLDSNDIYLCAKKWVGTKFHHQGRLKKSQDSLGGCDCLGLIMGVANELKVKSAKNINCKSNLNNNSDNIHLNKMLCAFDQKCYSCTPNGNHMYSLLKAHLVEDIKKDILPGKILLIKIRKNPQHLAIVGSIDNAISIIHALPEFGSVVEHLLDNNWKEKIHSCFSFFDTVYY